MSDWIEWEGDECQVPYDTLVEIKTMVGRGRVIAGTDRWDHAGHLGDIVAYRVVAPAEQPVSRGGVGAAETLRRAADLIEQRGKQRDSDTGERSMVVS